ncbi:hypothetical protein M885DRAFT_515007 [Pelagophyceae sp. CCMP2097]|nr:hypothetical protein M885DRAFT_515007 [Pelagophyceae sp. CCMP2097]|mmetsp:Transcript_23325/g.79616  ORF Transcript_23325/g.79616 Transcript_23325/m.79616 type:complete len:332 (-) Transcript_23325:56-1051(-)
MRAARWALFARLLCAFLRGAAALPGSLFDAALREGPLISAGVEDDLLLEADYDKGRYLAAAERNYKLTKRYSSYALPADSSAEARARWRRPLRVLAVGDSIAGEICAAINEADSAWTCSTVWDGEDPWSGTLTWARLDYERREKAEAGLARWLAAYDVVWVTEIFHWLRSGMLNHNSKNEFAPQVARLNHTRRVLESVRRCARTPAAAGKLAVFSTSMGLDVPFILAHPAKQDYNTFSDFSLPRAWGRLDERIGVEAGFDDEPNVLVAPLWRLSDQHAGLRCDGMHFGSYHHPVSGPKHVGVYGPFIAAVAGAAFDLQDRQRPPVTRPRRT